MDFRMSIGVEPMKMRTDRGIVLTGYSADARARRYARSVPAGKRSFAPEGSVSSRSAAAPSCCRAFGAAEATTRTGSRREPSGAAPRSGP
jgi:hypothetical protein